MFVVLSPFDGMVVATSSKMWFRSFMMSKPFFIFDAHGKCDSATLETSTSVDAFAVSDEFEVTEELVVKFRWPRERLLEKSTSTPNVPLY